MLQKCKPLFFCCFWFVSLRPSQQLWSCDFVRIVSSPNHTFFLGMLEQVVKQCVVHILSLVTDLNKTNLTKGYLRETCKSQNINPIYLTLSSPLVLYRS